MTDFIPTEQVQCTDWTAYVDSENAPAINASCQGTCKLTGRRWDAELIRGATSQEWMYLNFNPIDQADYPKLYAYLEASILNSGK